MAFGCNLVDLGVHILISRVLNNKTTFLWMFIFDNSHAKQKQNDTKAFD